MNFLNRWFARKDSQARTALAITQVGRPVGSGKNYEGFAREGYQSNVIAFKCVSTISQSCAGIPWLLKQKNSRGEMRDITGDHPIKELMKKPNPLQGWSAFMESVVAFYKISGNSYIEANRGVLGNVAPLELWSIRPDKMRIVAGKRGLPEAYEFQGATRAVLFPVDISGRSNMLHLKTFHPTDIWYGMSPIEAAMYSVDQHNESGKWNLSLLQNMGTPSGALVVKQDETNPMGALDPAVRANLEEKLQRKFGGSMNAGRMMLLEGGIEWKSMGFSAKDMDWLEGRKMSSRDIALAFGVPPIILNIPGDSTFNNYREARLAMYEDTVLPLMDMIRDEFNKWLVPMFGEKLFLDYDMDSIEALEPKRAEKWKKVQDADFLTINEKREALGYDPVEGGDDVLVPSSLVPLALDEPEPTPSGDSLPAGGTNADVNNLEREPGDDGDEGEDDPNEDEGKNQHRVVDIKSQSMKPTSQMIKLAAQGIEYRKEFGRGGSDIALARAREIAAGKSLTRATISRMISHFSRNESSIEELGSRPGEKGFPSDAAINWMLWGGDPADPKGAARAWAEAKMASLESVSEGKQINPLNRIDRVRTWKHVNDTRRKLATAMALDLDEAFDAQARALSKAMREASQDTREYAIMRAIDATSSEMESVVRKHVTRGLKTFSAPILAAGKSMPEFETKTVRRFNDFVEAFIARRTAEAIKEIEGTTIKKARRIVRDAVSEALEAGDSNLELAKKIESEFQGMSESRAMMIARTEMGIASNQGALEAAKALDLPGLKKEWVSIQDERTRDDDSEANHLSMNGVQVDIDQKFDVPADATMEGPGDPSAPASQVINCRCVLVFSRR